MHRSTPPTTGEIAYEAWWSTRWPSECHPYHPPYAALRPVEQSAWDAAAQAAAQAVLAMRTQEDTPHD